MAPFWHPPFGIPPYGQARVASREPSSPGLAHALGVGVGARTALEALVRLVALARQAAVACGALQGRGAGPRRWAGQELARKLQLS